MNANEFLNDNKKELDFDLKEDLVYFMNNDPSFYRHTYYPTMLKLNRAVNRGKRVIPSAFNSMVQNAYAVYRDKFFDKVPNLPKSLGDEETSQICDFVLEQETKNCNEGIYNDPK